MKFTLSQIPMPPSSNHQYAAMAVRGGHSAKNGERLWFGKLRPTRELEDYVKAVAAWAKTNEVAVAKAKSFIRNEILLKGQMVRIDTYACFHGTNLWTQKGLAKRMDGSNRIKALHDCLAEILQVDDSHFWSGSFEKLETEKGEPWVFVVLKPWAPRSVRDIDKETL